MILRNPVGSDPAKVVNVDRTFGEDDRYPEDAGERRHTYRYPYQHAYRRH